MVAGVFGWPRPVLRVVFSQVLSREESPVEGIADVNALT